MKSPLRSFIESLWTGLLIRVVFSSFGDAYKKNRTSIFGDQIWFKGSQAGPDIGDLALIEGQVPPWAFLNGRLVKIVDFDAAHWKCEFDKPILWVWRYTYIPWTARDYFLRPPSPLELLAAQA